MKLMSLTLLSLLLVVGCADEKEEVFKTIIKEDAMGKVVTLPAWKYEASAWSNIGTATKQGNNQVDFSVITVSKIKTVLGLSTEQLSLLSTSANINKWSGCQPGRWIAVTTPDSNGSLNLQYLAALPPHGMGEFAGYNHAATKPNIAGSTGGTIYYNQAGTTEVTVRYRLPDFSLAALGCTHAYLYDGLSGSANQVAYTELAISASQGRELILNGGYTHGAITGSSHTKLFYVYFGTPSEPRKHYIHSSTDAIANSVYVNFSVVTQSATYLAGSYGWTPPAGMAYDMSMLEDTEDVGTHKIKLLWRPRTGEGMDITRLTGTYTIYRATSLAGANLETVRTGVVVADNPDPIHFETTESVSNLTNTAGQTYYLLFDKTN